MTRRLAGALAALAVMAAACGGDDGTTTETAQGGTADATVLVGDGGELGDVLTDSEGQTLYVTEAEADGNISCTGGCLDAWPPLTVASDSEPTGGEGVDGTLATVTRDDGTVQVTYDGYPLYTFSGDGAAGDVSGHGITDEFDGTSFTWHAATPSGPAPLDNGESESDDGGTEPYDY